MHYPDWNFYLVQGVRNADALWFEKDLDEFELPASTSSETHSMYSPRVNVLFLK